MKPDHPSEPDLLAFLRGDLRAEAEEDVRRRLAAEPGLAEEHHRLEALFRTCRAAYDPVDDPREAQRVAAQVRDRVAAEERRAARERSRVAGFSPSGLRAVRGKAVWIRVLAASVFVHAVAVVALVLTSTDAPARRGDSDVLRVELPGARLDPPEGDDDGLGVPWPSTGRLADALPDPMFADSFPDPSRTERLPDVSPPLPEGLPALRERLREHPPSVALDMLVRTDDGVKRRRLQRLEIDADGTLTRVRRGLEAIEKAQEEDGSYAAAGGRTAVGETALAVLPFLGEGRDSSRRDVRPPQTVARALGWLRRTLFTAEVEGVDREVRLRDPNGIPVTDLGIALTALAEDYMLSFGRLSPPESARRVAEMETLTSALARRQGVEGGFEGASEESSASVWPIWGLYAAARTGTVAPSPQTVERFRRWYDERPRTSDGIPLRADGTPDAVLAAVGLLFGRGPEGRAASPESGQASWVVAAGLPERDGNLFAAAAGSALLLHDPASFRAWGHEMTDAIASRLQANGVVKDGDPVGDTALVLLALQAAYRTY